MSEQDEIVAGDTNPEVEEATISNESSEQDNAADLAEIESLRKATAQLTARARKAEAEVKSLKAQPVQNINNNNPQFLDELKLTARGISDEEIEQAKIVAKGKGISLIEAIKDPLFLTYQATFKENKRKEDAKLGASHGSGESQDETLITEDMTREEHMAAFKKVMGA